MTAKLKMGREMRRLLKERRPPSAGGWTRPQALLRCPSLLLRPQPSIKHGLERRMRASRLRHASAVGLLLGQVQPTCSQHPSSSKRQLAELTATGGHKHICRASRKWRWARAASS